MIAVAHTKLYSPKEMAQLIVALSIIVAAFCQDAMSLAHHTNFNRRKVHIEEDH